MQAVSRDFRVRCEGCGAAIELSVVVPEDNEAIEKEDLDELLVDYGWLPTSHGGYCPQHAAQARAKFQRRAVGRRLFDGGVPGGGGTRCIGHPSTPTAIDEPDSGSSRPAPDRCRCPDG